MTLLYCPGMGYYMPPDNIDVLWRWEADREWSSDKLRLVLSWHPIKKRTRCGARLENGRFVNLQVNKKWACETPDEAFISFKARKRRQVGILAAQLEEARAALELADAGRPSLPWE